jgi:hypothetical protein
MKITNEGSGAQSSNIIASCQSTFEKFVPDNIRQRKQGARAGALFFAINFTNLAIRSAHLVVTETTLV